MSDRNGLGIRTVVVLLRRNIIFVMAATLLGALAGLALSTINPEYQATVVVEVAPGADSAQTSTRLESTASTIVSPTIIDTASGVLGISSAQLAGTVTADVKAGTNLIDLTAVSDSPDSAIAAATTVVDVALTEYRAGSAARAKDVRASGADLLTNGTLAEPRAEAARQESIGAVVGSAQGQAIQGTVAVFIASPALAAAQVGVSRPVGIILGAAAGALLASLLVLSRTWNRRRPIRTLADLEYAAGVDSQVEPSARAAGVALSSGKSYILVLGRDEPSREALARRVSSEMALNGTSTALVVVTAGDYAVHQVDVTGSRWEIGAQQAAQILSRASRRDLPAKLAVTAVVVSAPLDKDTSQFLAGQDDYLALVAVPQGTRVAQAEAQFELVASADPIGVLQS